MRVRCMVAGGTNTMKMLATVCIGRALLAARFRRCQPAAATSFRWANDGDVATMDPDMLQETVQLSFLSNIYEPLVRRDKDLKLEPALATSWEQTGPTVWRFHLRPNVKLQDGSPFTADDVLFSLNADPVARPRRCARRCRW